MLCDMRLTKKYIIIVFPGNKHSDKPAISDAAGLSGFPNNNFNINIIIRFFIDSHFCECYDKQGKKGEKLEIVHLQARSDVDYVKK